MKYWMRILWILTDFFKCTFGILHICCVYYITDRNKIEPAHGLSVPIFCSTLIRNPDDRAEGFSTFLVRRCG